MARLVGDAIDRTLNVWLLGTYSETFNRVGTGGITDTATEIPCGLAVGEIGRGSLIAIEDELIYVVERDATNNRVVVVRGVRGTTAATHNAGTTIEVNPRFPRFLIRSLMVEEVDSWPNSLYTPQAFTASVAANGGTITLDDTINGFTPRSVIKLRRQSLSLLDDRVRRTDGYETQWGFDDGNVITLNCSIDTATTFKGIAACDFLSDAITSDTVDLIADVGLAPGMVEILELGTAYRLLEGRGSVRLFPEAEAQSRSTAEVGTRDIPALAAAFSQLHDRAINGEAQRLYGRFGFGGG